MATVEHSTLTTGELHEPKGIATAQANTVYIADGLGSGSWRLKPNAYCEYSDPVGTNFATPTSFTLLNGPSALKGIQREFSHNGAGRLTYTGASTIGVRIAFTVAYQHNVVAGIADFGIFKNGLPDSIFVSHKVSNAGEVGHVTMVVQTEMSTNDYIEVYGQASAGDVLVENFGLSIEGII